MEIPKLASVLEYSSREKVYLNLPQGWNAVVETNLTGTYLMSREGSNFFLSST